ncbi:MAG: 16S rRNA (cytidine(1402)-2'-O)-methyltransferase [Anaerolineales bacterium]|jgi:16S rRNA (cytidine1402-2'-O)-methyltransferase
MSTLFLVATPIGNLEDISARALRILREVSLIAAEDTRHTSKLLKHFEINTPLTSYFEHNKIGKLENILSKLAQGDVALVSDAGTPVLNDPGYELVRAALTDGHRVSPVPGPSAPLAALVASGLPTDRFLYLGYLGRKSAERRRQIAEIAGLPFTLIFLETPHRLLAALADLQSELGDRSLAVARELTKLHEEIFRGKISEAAAHFEAQPPKGEITLVIGGAPPEADHWDLQRVQIALKDGLSRGESVSSLAREISAQSGWNRREVYRLATEID